jgi:hypothetical protein
MAFPKVGNWSDRVYNAGAGGFNLLRDFEKEMWKVYPETRVYKFGFFSDDGVPEVSTYGWVHLQGGMFDVEDWNTAVGLRFGLAVDASDNVKYADNFIMIMPRQYREDVIYVGERKRIAEAENAADDAGAFVHPSDPEFNKMKDRARELASTEKFDLRPMPGAEPDRGEPPKNKGGRPRGSKNKPKSETA